MRATTDSGLRADLVTACHVLAAEGHNDLVWGHVAARASDGTGVWMKPSGLGMEEVGLDDLVLVGWDGLVRAGSRRRHAEYPLHTRVMALREDVGATVHSHAGSCSVLASLDTPLVPVSHEATYFAPHGVPVFARTSDLVLTDAGGDAVAETLGPASGLLLAGHGMLTAGGDLVEAVLAAVLLERACAKQLTALACGGPRRWTPPDEALAKRDHCYPRPLLEQAWEYLARTAAGVASPASDPVERR